MDIKKHSITKYEYIFKNGNSTIGNILQKELLRNKGTKIAGYNCPHPLETIMIFVLETKDYTNPKELIVECINNLIEKLNEIELKFSNTSDDVNE